mgnify:CR=1 FL=1
MARRTIPSVFCLEGDWRSDLRKRDSVRPILDLMAQEDKVKYIHRDVGTVEELEFYLRKWRQRAYQRYSIGYFAFHGEKGGIWIGRKQLSLVELADLMGSSCQGRIIYLGSCSTLGAGKRAMTRFLGLTKARCVCGYTTDVDWYPSAAFEILLFDAFTKFKRRDAMDRHLRKYTGLIRELGFKAYWRE